MRPAHVRNNPTILGATVLDHAAEYWSLSRVGRLRLGTISRVWLGYYPRLQGLNLEAHTKYDSSVQG